MTTSEQLEREAEAARAHISATLDELRARMTPGQVVDQLVDYANDTSGGMFISNLKRQAVSNPLPVALMGAGLAWLAISSRRGSANGGGASTASRLADRPRHVVARAGDGFGRIRAGAANAGRATRQTAGEWADRAQSAAQDANDRLAEGATATHDAAVDRARRTGEAIKDSASGVGRDLAGANRRMMALFHDQPLFLAGLGVALGALIGAALPSSEAEDELMGEKSDAVKREATDLAEEQAEKGRAVAEQAWQSAKAEAEDQGLTGGHAEDGARHAQQPTSTEATLVPSVGDSEHRTVERSGT